MCANHNILESMNRINEEWGERVANLFSPVLKFFTQESEASSSAADENQIGVEKTTTANATQEIEEEVEEEEAAFCPYAFMKNLPAYHTVAIPDRKQVLPKIAESNKKALVLDLDETLVHCSVDEIPNADHKFMVDFYGQTYAVHARKRPYIDHFLERVAKHFEVVVFTASQVGQNSWEGLSALYNIY